jgi:hypothetical protein
VPAIRQVVSAQIVRSIHPVTAAAHADLWICGQRKRVAHIPTGSKNNKSKRQFDCFGSTAVRPGPSQPRPSARAAATLVVVFGTYPGRHSQPFRIGRGWGLAAPSCSKGRPPISRGMGVGCEGRRPRARAGPPYRERQNVHAEAAITINGGLPRLGSAYAAPSRRILR